MQITIQLNDELTWHSQRTHAVITQCDDIGAGYQLLAELYCDLPHQNGQTHLTLYVNGSGRFMLAKDSAARPTITP